MRKVYFIFLIFILSITACVTTNFVSFKDPSFRLRKLNSTLVYVGNLKTEYRRLLENKIVKNLRQESIDAFSYLNMFPPIKDYKKSFIQSKLSKAGCKFLLTVEIKNENSASSTVGYQAIISDNSVYSFPINSSYRTTRFVTKITEIGTRQPVWMTESKTEAKGLFYVGIETTLKNFASSLIRELEDEGMILK